MSPSGLNDFSNQLVIQSSFVVEQNLLDYNFVCIYCQWLSLKIFPQWHSALDDWCILASSEWFKQILFIYWLHERDQHLSCSWLIRNIHQCCSSSATEGAWLQSLTQLLHAGYLVYVHVDHTCQYWVTAVAPNLAWSVSPKFWHQANKQLYFPFCIALMCYMDFATRVIYWQNCCH